jgi:hypothetical protein
MRGPLSRPSLLLAAALGACALSVAGCGGGTVQSGSTASGTTAAATQKKAMSPNAPAGAKVVTCKESEAELTELRASGVGCGTARKTMRQWSGHHDCTLGAKDTRGSCSLGEFRCQAVRTGGAASVSCAHSGGDVTFIAKAWSPTKKKGPAR